MLSNYIWLFLTNALQSELNFWVRSNKEEPCEQGFPGSCCTSRIVIIIWIWSFWGAPNSYFPIQWWLGCWFLQLLWLWCCWFRAGERSMGLRQVKMLTALIVLAKIKPFFLNKHFWTVSSFWLISRVLKILILTVFPVFSLLLWRSRFLEVLTLPFWKCFPPMKNSILT